MTGQHGPGSPGPPPTSTPASQPSPQPSQPPSHSPGPGLSTSPQHQTQSSAQHQVICYNTIKKKIFFFNKLKINHIWILR